MSYYYFADLSHHKGDLDIQVLANAGHRLVITKASDNYNLPDRNGRYEWNPQRHTDSRFVQNYVGARKAGLAAGAYHFCRWDRPLGVGRDGIIEANLQYFQEAIEAMRPDYQNIKTVILDMEQPGTQLQAAGLGKAAVSGMAVDMVRLFGEHYENLILYSGSWWSNEWLLPETTKWMAERMMVWEPEYTIRDGSITPPDPNYKPSVPVGFSNEYAVKWNDVGKMFAWQFTDKGNFYGSDNIDTNQYMMPKDEVFKLFGTDGAVDPPDPPPPTPGVDPNEILADLNALGGLNKDMGNTIQSLITKYEQYLT